MQVKLHDIGKSYQHHAVFQHIDYEFNAGYRGVVLGGNGSGKSTFLKVLSTATVPTSGTVQYLLEGKAVAEEERYKHVAYCAPYIDLIEDFSLLEIIDFQSKFMSFQNNLTAKELSDLLYLERFATKPIKSYSSGMKQRVKLALAICADSPLLLLDEPTSNLDSKGISWYKSLIQDFACDRIILVASNRIADEYDFTTDQISIEDYK